jgi:aspartyl protease family protein
MSQYRSLMGEVVGCLVIAGVAAAVAINHVEVMAFFKGQAVVKSESRAPQPAKSADDDDAPKSRNGVELRADRTGHFSAKAYINGSPVEVLVDTGATVVALSFEDAERAGVYVRPGDFNGRVSTANGTARVAQVQLDSVSIGDIRVRNVRAVVSERGAMSGTLLGMSFLSKLGKVEMGNGRLLLTE